MKIDPPEEVSSNLFFFVSKVKRHHLYLLEIKKEENIYKVTPLTVNVCLGLNYSFTCLLLLVVTVVTVAVTGSDNSLSVLVQEQISRAVCCTALHPALHYFGKEIQRNLTWNATALRIKTQYIDQKDHNYLVSFARFPKKSSILVYDNVI